MTRDIATRLREAAAVSRMLEPDHAAMLATAANEIDSLRKRIEQQTQAAAKAAADALAAKQRATHQRGRWR